MISRSWESTYLVVSVGEVQTRHVHAGIEHLDEHFHIPAGWTEGADNFGLSGVGIDCFEDVVKFDSGGVGASLCLFYHSILTACSWFCAFLVVRLYLILTLLLILNKRASARSLTNPSS